jgi:hypothetical protein
MQQRGGGEELVELAQARAGAANCVGAGDVPHASQQVGDGVFAGGSGGAVDNLVRIVDAEGDDVAVLQLAAFHLFAVYEEPAALAAIFDVMLVGLNYDRGASARNTAVGKLQVVPGFGAAADEKRRLRHAHEAVRPVWRNHLQNRLRHNGYSIRHTSFVRDCNIF